MAASVEKAANRILTGVTDKDILLQLVSQIGTYMNDMGVSRRDGCQILNASRRAAAMKAELTNNEFAALTNCKSRTVSATSPFPEELIDEALSARSSSPIALVNTLLRQRQNPMSPLEIAKALEQDGGLDLTEKEIAALYGQIHSLCEEAERSGMLDSVSECEEIRYKSNISTYEYATPKKLVTRVEQRLRASEVLAHPVSTCSETMFASVAITRLNELRDLFHQSNASRPVRKILEVLEDKTNEKLSTAPNFGVVVALGPASGAKTAQLHALEVLSRSDDHEKRILIPTRACLNNKTFQTFQQDYWNMISEWHLQQLKEFNEPSQFVPTESVQLSIVTGWFPDNSGQLKSEY